MLLSSITSTVVNGTTRYSSHYSDYQSFTVNFTTSDVEVDLDQVFEEFIGQYNEIERSEGITDIEKRVSLFNDEFVYLTWFDERQKLYGRYFRFDDYEKWIVVEEDNKIYIELYFIYHENSTNYPDITYQVNLINKTLRWEDGNGGYIL